MSDRDALIRAICESPDDDTVRLVFADWLDEHGDPARAAFIRLQCALEGIDPFTPGLREPLQWEWDAIRWYGEHWISEDGLADMVTPDSLWHCPPKTRFRRGFIDRAWFDSPDHFLRTAPALFTRAPITGITLWSSYSVGPDQREWFDNTYYEIYRREHGLAPGAMPGGGGTEFPEPDEFRRLVESPLFGKLRSFAMNTLYIDRRHLEILTTSPAAANLRELDLSGNICLVGEAWAPLAESPPLAELESLSLDECYLGLTGLGLLVNSPHLANLRRLSLEGEPERSALGPQGIELICGSRALTQLRELNLHGQSGGAAGLRALGAWPGLARLTRLDLSHFSAYEEEGERLAAWAAFVRSPHLGALRELNLEGGNLEELEAILDSPNLATLCVLTFACEFCSYVGHDEVPLQDEAAALLARCPHLADGLELHLSCKGLSEDAHRQLRDRFGEGLVLYPADYRRHRLPGEWASGRPPRCTFHSE
jgi:uncharacterized protein (TIGR02996 family)